MLNKLGKTTSNPKIKGDSFQIFKDKEMQYSLFRRKETSTKLKIHCSTTAE